MKFGLIGCGRWGRLVLRDLLQLGVTVHVVARSDATRSAAVQQGAKAAYRTLEALPPMDGMIVVTPSATHADILQQLQRRTEPIFCEKPLTTDIATARTCAEELGARLFIMGKWRDHNGILALAKLAQSGALGPVQGLKTRRLGWGHPHRDCDPLWILMPHEIAIAYEILGAFLVPTQVTIEQDQGERLHAATVSFSGQGFWHLSEIGVRTTPRDRSIRLYCRDGVATLADAMADHIVINRNPVDYYAAETGQTEERIAVAVNMPLYDELRVFRDFIRGGKPPKSDAAFGLKVVETVASIRTMAGLSA